MVAMIQRESRRAAQVTRDLLSFVRVDDHQRGDVSLNELAREVVALRAVQQKAAGVTTSLELAEPLPTVTASRAQILQVLVNLVTNAEDALEGRATKEIRISTYHSGGAVMLRVEDNGPGIADEHKARLFEPFFTTKAPGKGTGLGLALSFAIADRHGGSLRPGDAPGGGARFTIELPLEAARVAA